MNKLPEIVVATDRGPSIQQFHEGWFWADETWLWHGPCSTEESARERQSMYCDHIMTNNLPQVTPPAEWKRLKDTESESTIHPCHCAEPWDCECAGACSCHWLGK